MGTVVPFSTCRSETPGSLNACSKVWLHPRRKVVRSSRHSDIRSSGFSTRQALPAAMFGRGSRPCAGTDDQHRAMSTQQLREGDGVEDGDALPGAKRDVVDPTAIGSADLLFGPFVDEEGGFEVFGFAGGVGYAQERVDGVAA